jgi:hypothetical protein
VGTHGRGRENGGWRYRPVRRRGPTATERRWRGHSRVGVRVGFAEWAHGGVGLGLVLIMRPGSVKQAGSYYSRWARPVTPFLFTPIFFQGISNAPSSKIQIVTFLKSKIFKFDMVVEYLKRNNFPFGKKFKFPIQFELKFQDAKQS